MKERYIIVEESIYAERPHDMKPARAKPQRTTVLEWIGTILVLLPCFVWGGWLFGLGTIEPAEMHNMVVGSVMYLVLGFIILICAPHRKERG